MFLNRNQRGFGWHTKIESENLEPMYLDFSFKKGCDPVGEELNEYESIKCDLYLKTSQGYRKVYPVIKTYNGTQHVEFKVLELIEEKAERRGGVINPIEPDDLPFY